MPIPEFQELGFSKNSDVLWTLLLLLLPSRNLCTSESFTGGSRISRCFNALEESLTKCIHNRESETVELSLSLLLFPVIHAISGNLSVIWGLSCTNFYSTLRDLGQTVFAGQSGVVKHVATLLRCALGDVEDDKFWGPIQNSRKAGKNTICSSMWRHGFGKQLTTTPDLVCNTEWNQVWPVTNSWCINQY
jgi:hypothetical protein